MMIEESLVHSFLTLNYAEANFFKRSLSITKSLVNFYGDNEYKQEVGYIEKFCAGILRTKNGRKFYISFHVLEQAYLRNSDKTPDTLLEFELADTKGLTQLYELSLMDVINYLYVLHEKLLDIVVLVASKHGISIGDMSGGGNGSNPLLGNAPTIPIKQQFELPHI